MTAERYEAVIIGAGAAGMFCAAQAAQRGGRVLCIDHARSPGEKIRISGGGRCNFTNLHTEPGRFISGNPHFAKSALARYSQWDFIDRVARRGIAYHEKTLGQLFCDGSAKEIIQLLLDDMAAAGAELRLRTSASEIEKTADGFRLALEREGGRDVVETGALVIASGGKSIPKLGATGFGYRVAEQFELRVTETRPGLVPLTFGDDARETLKELAGVSVEGVLRSARAAFDEALLFTHRGLSGPAVLQISSYWREGESVRIGMIPSTDVFQEMREARAASGKRSPATALSALLPKRLAQLMCDLAGLRGNLADQSDGSLRRLADLISDWELKPTGSEGYRTAEVTLGGVDTADLDSRTMAAKAVPGLYFIGEVVDVTGWLGGYNFQWAWSSGWAAGTAIADASSG